MLGLHDISPGDLAVQADFHEPAWPQDIDQHLPTRDRVLHMMQDANAFNKIELSSKLMKIKNISLSVFDIFDA